MKKLTKMTLEELWKLFPINLVPYDINWKKKYDDEAKKLRKLFDSKINFSINHIGSTAIPNIYSKPIIDILFQVEDLSTLLDFSNQLQTNGYIKMSESKTRISLNKGYTNKGYANDVFHLHLRLNGDNDEIFFRDALIDNPNIAKEYETLKLSLWKKYEFDRDGYTNAKSDFIKKITESYKKNK